MEKIELQFTLNPTDYIAFARSLVESGEIETAMAVLERGAASARASTPLPEGPAAQLRGAIGAARGRAPACTTGFRGLRLLVATAPAGTPTPGLRVAIAPGAVAGAAVGAQVGTEAVEGHL